MLRKIVEIDETLCNGCGECVPNCAEGALKIIDGKARMISDLFCDGLGACLGHCPAGALQVIEREAEPYDEWRVMEKIVRGGANVIREHLEHMRKHGELEYLKTARDYLSVYGISDPTAGESTGPRKTAVKTNPGFTGCPGAAAAKLARKPAESAEDFSELSAWPVQLHLANPSSPAYRGADLLLAADCAAYAAGNFHARYLRGKSLAIACPKLDSGRERYIEKLAVMMAPGGISSVTIVMMEVPCCGGLVQMVREARAAASSRVPVKAVVLSIRGEKIAEHEVA